MQQALRIRLGQIRPGRILRPYGIAEQQANMACDATDWLQFAAAMLIVLVTAAIVYYAQRLQAQLHKAQAAQQTQQTNAQQLAHQEQLRMEKEQRSQQLRQQQLQTATSLCSQYTYVHKHMCTLRLVYAKHEDSNVVAALLAAAKPECLLHESKKGVTNRRGPPASKAPSNHRRARRLLGPSYVLCARFRSRFRQPLT
jgi:hypothetical protein